MTEFVLGGGCFWCLDAVFRKLHGVTHVESGYAGPIGSPNYYAVASGATEFIEVVLVRFDEHEISADTILDIFFLIHNPTTPNRQGADIGPQYRSVMFFTGPGQELLFKAALSRAQRHWNDPIVTDIAPLQIFYPAEAEHQDYFAKNPEAGYCQIVIAPKVIKARKHYEQWFKEEEG